MHLSSNLDCFPVFHTVLKLAGTSQQCNPAFGAGRTVAQLLALCFSIHSALTARVSRDIISIAQYQVLFTMNHGKQDPQLIPLGGKILEHSRAFELET